MKIGGPSALVATLVIISAGVVAGGQSAADARLQAQLKQVFPAVADDVMLAWQKDARAMIG